MSDALRPLHLPDPVSWYPQAAGWAIVAAAIACALALWSARRLRFWHRNRYRRQADRHLRALDPADLPTVATELPRVLRAVALHAYPRATITPLHGQDWLAFLDAHYSGPPFHSPHGDLLLALTYQPAQASPAPGDVAALLHMARLWVRTHTTGGPAR